MMQERNAQRMDRDCMKVAVLSDTHNLLRPQVAALLGTCDAVIHAGDIGSLQEITMAFLYLGKGHVQVERVDLPAEPVSGRGKRDLDKREDEKDCRIPEDNLLSAIEGIFRRMDRGWKIERISREMKLDADFVEQVCRIRVTHPGVSAEGIMDKIEVNRQTGAR